MNLLFAITALLTLGSAIAAMSLRNLVHCVLCLTVTFAGIALTYLQLGAQFIGFAQVLVYIGAVSILVIFALLMTRGGSELRLRDWNPVHWITGGLVVLGTFGIMAAAILKSPLRQTVLPEAKEESIQRIGASLLDTFVLPLEALALLLTVALIGAALLAMPERRAKADPTGNGTEKKGATGK